jgi:hypothetical protein
MSIAPVSSVPTASSELTNNASVRSSPTQANPASEVANETAQAVSGTLSKQNSSAARNVSSTYELPQDVVEVHQDPDIKNQIIIQYLDQANDVVLQVPSNQELSVERGIAQEFQQAAKLRESEGTAASGREGEKTHGD